MSHLQAQFSSGDSPLSEDPSAFVEFIENELDLDDDECDLPLVIANDWPEREQRIAEALEQRAAAYQPPRVQVVDKTTFLIFSSVLLFLVVLMLISRFA